ncbi:MULTISPECIES: hypothetical protein [Methylobacterium]|uniref:Uncharacterized protein n=1 Tax=Methylobacterium longum TaxID=767694 RepID=A0ABT8ALB0_9HYPH|nr:MULTISPECIES: hypothetical protein [Methylobacterium]MCJ2101695.1 hypothetical protein [Methylobacterium sp. E-046]MDN3570600.1 hypothetical protein [Methylobacterium longum]GJE09743.1 hypothetical protein FOHLNKBM_0769 [Methylobacterium longum]
MAGLARSTRRRRRCHRRDLAAALVLLILTLATAVAQEPLFIRIRPLPDAEAARVARESLWARRQAHARTVIESVCRGCLGAWKPEPASASAPPLATAEDRIANLTVRIGVELDPGSGASEQHPDPSISERHP